MVPRLFLLLIVCQLVKANRQDLLQRLIEVNSDESAADSEEDPIIPPDPPIHSGPLYAGVVVKDGVIHHVRDMDTLKPNIWNGTYVDEDDISGSSDVTSGSSEGTSGISDEERRGIMHVLRRLVNSLEIGTDPENSLNKRIVTNSPYKLWPKCIIPYMFSDLTQSQIDSIKQAFQIFETYTCFRFYKWYTTISEDFDLGHNNYLEFIYNGGKCNSAVGMTNNNKGQKISCCGAGICVHELGHAFGFIHEQVNPLRDDYIRVNFDNVRSDSLSLYTKKNTGNVATFPWKYDLSSVMHYGLRAFVKPGSGPTMTMRDPLTTYLVQNGDNTYYYFIRELEALYSCKDLKCPTDNRVCHYDGYLTFQNNQCSCRCIYGLDSDTDCSSLLKKDSRLYSTDWPTVPFAMLKAKGVPCPVGSKEGSLKHYGLSNTGERNDADGIVTDTDTEMKFCTFTDSKRTGDAFTFSPGQYCINRVGGSCPTGFTSGYVQYDDAGPPEISGSLPDGDFDEDALIEFCCRNDGNYRIPIELPLKQRFILWQAIKGSCQEVKDAAFLGTQYFGFKNPKENSIAYVQEPIPYYTNNIWLYFCVYQPITKGNCGGIIELTEDSSNAVITSPNYPNPYNDYSECTWIVRSPVNTRVVLDFIDFNIPNSIGATSCEEDQLEIKFTLPGQPGLRLCGSDYKVSTVSETNIMSLVLHSMGSVTTPRNFKAKVKMTVKDDELCYKTSDRGATYRGHVNFAQDMKICLPWRSVSHCPHNVFEYSDYYDGLDENYCRTPGHGLRPFCYTASDGCVPNYCDVCGVGSCKDIYDDCMERFLADNTYCSDNLHIAPEGTIGCAATCNMCGRRISERANTITCAMPAMPADSSVSETLKNVYAVGETVNFECIHNPIYSAKHTCTTSGKWEGPMSACQGCPDDWLQRDGNCYKFFAEPTSAVEASQHCSNFNGGTMIVAEDMDFVYEIMNPDKVAVWLGLDDVETEGTFLWKDGTPLDTTKLGASWKSGQPDDKGGQDCVDVNKSKKLSDQSCETKTRAYICQSPIKVPTKCKDAREDCASILYDVPNMCTEHKVFADIACRQTCEICTAPSQPCPTK